MKIHISHIRKIEVEQLPDDWEPNLVRNPLLRNHFICIPF